MPRLKETRQNGSISADATRAGFAPSEPAYTLPSPDARIYTGDCREILPRIPEVRAGAVDLVFADPPFNWNRAYDKWDDALPEGEYLAFTYTWLDLCIGALRPGGSLWVNIPDDWAAEIVWDPLESTCRHASLSIL